MNNFLEINGEPVVQLIESVSLHNNHNDPALSEIMNSTTTATSQEFKNENNHEQDAVNDAILETNVIQSATMNEINQTQDEHQHSVEQEDLVVLEAVANSNEDISPNLNVSKSEINVAEAIMSINNSTRKDLTQNDVNSISIENENKVTDPSNTSNTTNSLSAASSSSTQITSTEEAKCDNSQTKTKHELAAVYGFNEDQIGIFEETFQIFDKDCDGFISLVEIRTVMNALGFFPCDENIRKSIQNIDNDNSGTVDFEEFISMMSKFRKVKTTNELDDELMEIFKIFDKNKDGFIDKAELKDILTRLGENITDDEVFDMIKEADLDGDNRVSFSEFRSILYDNKAR